MAIDGGVDLRTDQIIHVHARECLRHRFEQLSNEWPSCHQSAGVLAQRAPQQTERTLFDDGSGQFSITDLLAIADGYDVPG